MQVLPLGRSSLAQTAVVSLLTLAAVAVFGLVLAYWTWIWFAPLAAPRAGRTRSRSSTRAPSQRRPPRQVSAMTRRPFAQGSIVRAGVPACLVFVIRAL